MNTSSANRLTISFAASPEWKENINELSFTAHLKIMILFLISSFICCSRNLIVFLVTEYHRCMHNNLNRNVIIISSWVHHTNFQKLKKLLQYSSSVLHKSLWSMAHSPTDARWTKEQTGWLVTNEPPLSFIWRTQRKAAP